MHNLHARRKKLIEKLLVEKEVSVNVKTKLPCDMISVQVFCCI